MDLLRLDQISQIIAGQSPPSTTYNKDGDGLPFFQGKADFGELYPNVRVWCSKPKKIAENGDILISVRAPVGSTNICNEKACIGRGLSAIRVSDRLNNYYLLYYLRYIEKKLASLGNGSTFKSITQKDLQKIIVPLPSIEEQKNIVKILEYTDALRQKRKEAIKLLDEYLISVFLDMFGDIVENQNKWELLNSEKYSELLTVGVVIKPASYYKKSGVVALRSLNIKANKIDINNVVFFSQEDNDAKLAKSKLKKNDIVIVRTGLTGTAAIIPEELDGANCIDLIILRPKTKIVNSVYLCYLLNSRRGKQLISSKEVGGIQKHFNVGALKKLSLPIPPINLQNDFADIVIKTEKLKQKMLEQSVKLENQFQSLMQQCFKH